MLIHSEYTLFNSNATSLKENCKLNDEEKTAADAFKKEADARQAEMIKKFDKDGDGKLSDDEKKAAREAFMKSHGEGKGGHEGKSDKPKEEKK